MPCDYKEYPDNWKWLSKQLRKDRGNKCELCYAPNGLNVARFDNSSVHTWEYLSEVDDRWGDYKKTKIVLTVHHIDSDKQNNDLRNLIVLCQRCHLRLDLHKHIKNRKAKHAKKKEIDQAIDS